MTNLPSPKTKAGEKYLSRLISRIFSIKCTSQDLFI